MRVTTITGILGLLIVALAPAAQAQEKTVRIEFGVNVPKDTPPDAAIYMAGNHRKLGGWKADGLKLATLDKGLYYVAIDVPTGTVLEYKFTRGSWETVEKGPGGEEIPNRTLTCNRDLRLPTQVAAWADPNAPVAPRKPTRSGNIRELDDFESKILQNRRSVLIYLPPGYDKDTDRRYPVLYMHDGQNCFDDATSFAGEWKADETAERLINEGKIEPIIIVAVANAGADRMNEYTPTVETDIHQGGRGDLYARFLMSELKPVIDKTYRTRPDRDHTAVCGSSLGGLISMHIARTYPDAVGRCAAVSPSLWWNDSQMIAQLRSDPAWTANCRIWLDMGTAESASDTEGKHVALTQGVAAILEDAGRKRGSDFFYHEVPDGQHNEAAWAARFDRVLLFLFGK